MNRFLNFVFGHEKLRSLKTWEFSSVSRQLNHSKVNSSTYKCEQNNDNDESAENCPAQKNNAMHSIKLQKRYLPLALHFCGSLCILASTVEEIFFKRRKAQKNCLRQVGMFATFCVLIAEGEAKKIEDLDACPPHHTSDSLMKGLNCNFYCTCFFLSFNLRNRSFLALCCNFNFFLKIWHSASYFVKIFSCEVCAALSTFKHKTKLIFCYVESQFFRWRCFY